MKLGNRDRRQEEEAQQARIFIPFDTLRMNRGEVRRYPRRSMEERANRRVEMARRARTRTLSFYAVTEVLPQR